MNKPDRLALIKTLLLSMPPDIGWRPCDLEQALALRGVVVHYRVITRDLQEIGATRIGRGRYTYTPTPEEVERARLIMQRAEGVAAK